MLPLVLLVATGAQAQSWIQRHEDFIGIYEGLPRPPDGGVVITGDSNILLWRSARWLLALRPLIMRGFGGSTTAELNHYLDRIVLSYRPRAVVIGEGENDVDMGYSPGQIASLHGQILSRIHSRNSETRVYIIGLKPSPARSAQWVTFQKTNALLEDACAAHPPCRFVPPPAKLLDRNGEPIAWFYRKDKLHLNWLGYWVWNASIGDAIVRGEARARVKRPITEALSRQPA